MVHRAGIHYVLPFRPEWYIGPDAIISYHSGPNGRSVRKWIYTTAVSARDEGFCARPPWTGPSATASRWRADRPRPERGHRARASGEPRSTWAARRPPHVRPKVPDWKLYTGTLALLLFAAFLKDGSHNSLNCAAIGDDLTHSDTI